MLNHVTYIHPTSTQWVTFVHGAGGSYNTWFKQIKAFKTNFNVLLLDLRGHGNSEGSLTLKDVKYTFAFLANDIITLLDYLKIAKSHFVGISLGTIIVRELAQLHPQRVTSLVLAGAIMKLNLRSWILVKLGNIFKFYLPYITLYTFFAYIIMPRTNHKISRDIFINEAKKLNQLEFIKWFSLASEVNPVLKMFRKTELPKPTLYILGDQDAMFLPEIKELVNKQNRFSTLVIVKNCGHVVNLDSAYFFNQTVVAFIHQHAV
ncbi:MAG: alpha/beta hydrolase [Sphingobacteriales bacterium]|nr:MAG: alpha/beta hydrolase [Sphingobacteriales bacterium]